MAVVGSSIITVRKSPYSRMLGHCTYCGTYRPYDEHYRCNWCGAKVSLSPKRKNIQPVIRLIQSQDGMRCGNCKCGVEPNGGTYLCTNEYCALEYSPSGEPLQPPQTAAPQGLGGAVRDGR
jgi:DNA-directed RNA polymerase subunit RPC12/RpoP